MQLKQCEHGGEQQEVRLGRSWLEGGGLYQIFKAMVRAAASCLSERFFFKEVACSDLWITRWDWGEEGQRQGDHSEASTIIQARSPGKWVVGNG